MVEREVDRSWEVTACCSGRSRASPLDIAIVPGVTPLLGLAASYKAPLGADEVALAGG